MENKKLKLINELKNKEILSELKEINELINYLDVIKEKMSKNIFNSYKISNMIRNKDINIETTRELSAVSTRLRKINEQLQRLKEIKYTFIEECSKCKTLTKINKLKEINKEFVCNECIKKENLK